jgi:hypothetical protein
MCADSLQSSVVDLDPDPYVLGLLDPDPLVIGTDLDLSIIKQKWLGNLDSYCFVTSLLLFIVEK